MNKQRESVYSLRRELLEGKIKLEDEDEAVDTRAYLMTLAEDLVDGLVDTHAGKDTNPEDWDLGALRRSVADLFGLEPQLVEDIKLESMSAAEMSEVLREFVIERYDEKEKTGGIPSEILRRVERDVMLQIVDAQWKDHLYSLDHLKEGIGLRGYGQRDPLVEYKKESFELFKAMQGRVEEDMVRYLWRIRPVIQTGNEDAPPPPPVPVRQPPRRPQQLTMTGGSSSAASLPPPRAAASTSGVPGGAPKPARTGGDDALVRTVRRDEPKIGRNDPCWCGSGKKFKKCHGA
jgi:preprotein translocase subunit SecA